MKNLTIHNPINLLIMAVFLKEMLHLAIFVKISFFIIIKGIHPIGSQLAANIETHIHPAFATAINPAFFELTNRIVPWVFWTTIIKIKFKPFILVFWINNLRKLTPIACRCLQLGIG